MHKLSTHTRAHVSLYLSILALALAGAGAIPAEAAALGRSPVTASGTPTLATVAPTLATATASGEETGSLESAATKAGETGRKIAMSLIGLGFAIASIVLAFRRDFKEAAGIFAVGFVAILLATPTGVNVLHDTVNTLFGSS
jgi:hypothetical protein